MSDAGRTGALRPGGLGEREFADLIELRQRLQSELKLLLADQQAAATRIGDIRSVLSDVDSRLRRPVRPPVRLPGYLRRPAPPHHPPPVPPPAPNAIPVSGRHLRYAALAVLIRAGTPLTLTEIHRGLHLNGFVIASNNRVKALADALGYEHRQGRARRTARGVYAVGELSPWRRRQALRGYGGRPAGRVPAPSWRGAVG